MEVKPSALMQIAGGALLFIGSFLDWWGFDSFGFSGTDTDVNGLQGLFALVIGAAIAVVAALSAFAPQVNLPQRVAGFSLDRLLLMLAFSAFLMSFGAIFWDIDPIGPKIGIHLSWIGAAVATVGYFLESNEDAPAPSPSN